MIRTLLIANRGEIARRVLRTARRLGMRTIAVYSDADAGAPHVREADAAFRLGPAPAPESYLRIDAVLAAARASGADAIHPGYGFLAENADFAEACRDAGVIFVGPSPGTMRELGLKGAAKRVAERVGVPTLPGYHGEDQADRVLAREAKRIGLPLVIKAAAGGGGRGMRVVNDLADFPDLLASARREAMGAFDDDRVILERFLARPRHVEVQIVGDGRGEVVHLFERDCSLQRRHQKLIEEAPAPGLHPDVRAKLHAAAVALGRAVAYANAGTVEFLVEGDAFFFLEVNTRLQVEHPVTEEITGIDLVEWQLRIAAGEPLPLSQDRIVAAGHAAEARLCAEDPERDFLPQTGVLRRAAFPRWTTRTRIEAGVAEGETLGIAYDSMIAKAIGGGPDRASALRALDRALAGTEIVGVRTNLAFLRAVIRHPAFAAGEVDTAFFARHEGELRARAEPVTDADLAAAALALVLARREPPSPWAARAPWRLNAPAEETLVLRCEGREHAVGVVHEREAYRVGIGDRAWPAGARLDGERLTLDLGGERAAFTALVGGGAVTLVREGIVREIALVDPLAGAGAHGEADAHVRAPMPGRILKVLAAAGDAVARGQPLVVLEAMKMEHAIVAPVDGVIERLPFAVGDLVEEGAEIAHFVEG